jgi:cell wall-associated NlpC family hydrolase
MLGPSTPSTAARSPSPCGGGSTHAVRADQVVAEYRAWRDTPIEWGQCAKGVGCDCKGVIVGTARALGLPEGDSLHAGMADYPKRVPVPLLRAGLAATLDRVRDPLPGDVLLMCMDGKAQHLGGFTGTGVVHAYGRGPRHLLRCVIETPIDVALRAWPLDSAWRWRSVAYGVAA